ncbi:unnamed protein product, partial [Tuber aestivum]
QGSQFLVYFPVTPQDLLNINHLRDTRYKGLRFLYLENPQTLIVKIMPGGIHEQLIWEFGYGLRRKVDRMGLGRALRPMGSTTYQGVKCAKEADAAFEPRLPGPYDRYWPTLVVECGVSESLKRLRVDSDWWLQNSEGAVKTVLVFSVSKATRHIHLEQWENGNSSKSATANPPITPTKINEIDIMGPMDTSGGVQRPIVTGAPLKLEFEKIFLRQPDRRCGEDNIIFTAQQLGLIASGIW